MYFWEKYVYQYKKTRVSALVKKSGDEGIRTLVPQKRGQRISSAPRYDRFDTTPYFTENNYKV